MKRRMRLLRSEEGQSIVLVAAVMVGLLALAGLAIDGGNMFLQRRRVQNSADAGALAGTRVLAQLIAECQSGDAGDDAQVALAVTEFVAGNGFSEEDGSKVTAWYVNADAQALGDVGAGSIPQSATGVGVLVEAEIPTHFLRVVGIESGTLSADAGAMTGEVVQLSSGVLPIGVPLEVVLALDPGEPFVVLENNQHNGGSFCVDENGNGQYDESYDLCIGDPASHNAHRGWLNLNYIYNVEHLAESDPFYRTIDTNVSVSGCNTDPPGLQGYASGECPYPYPIFRGTPEKADGDFIHGSPGASTSGLHEIAEHYIGQIAYIPVFDYIYMSDYLAEYLPAPEGGIGWPRAGGGGHAYLYHIVGFTRVRVNDVGNHVLAAEFQEAIIGEGMIQPGEGIGSGACSETSLLYGINLWR